MIKRFFVTNTLSFALAEIEYCLNRVREYARVAKAPRSWHLLKVYINF